MVYESPGIRRRPSPVRPFDLVPPQMVEAAKRLFAQLKRNGMVGQLRLMTWQRRPPARLGEPGLPQLPEG
jgi:hypothetical protein